jgi:hypothetical protein
MGKGIALLILKFAADGHEWIFHVSGALPSLAVTTEPVWTSWRRNEPQAAAGYRITYGAANNFVHRFINFSKNVEANSKF